MRIYGLNNITPEVIDPNNSWIAPNSYIIGNVVIHSAVSVWFGAVIRGDNEKITIKCKCNIQENSILHTDKGYPLNIGSGCTIGHSCILHGCQISSNSLIGMGSILMNGSKIGQNCIVGAGSLILQDQIIPEGTLSIGRPAKIIRKLTKLEVESIHNSANGYFEKIELYKNNFEEILL